MTFLSDRADLPDKGSVMTERPRFIENRMVFVVQPKAPFIAWVRRVDPEACDGITLDMVKDDPNVFLIPIHPQEADIAGERWLRLHWRVLLERILREWDIAPPLWPGFQALDAFREWFDVKVHSVVLDCSSEPIEYEKEADAA